MAWQSLSTRASRSAVESMPPGMIRSAQRRVGADLRLWETYNRRIDEAAGLFEEHHALRFEQLLQEPDEELDRLAAFLGRSGERGGNVITQLIDVSRTGRYQEADACWEAFASSRALSQYGYGRSGSK